jgi:ubiquinone/menaquinone biosynthesis C-methylase UbiE
MQRPQYGIDAPDLVRFFFTSGVVTLAVFLAAQTLKMTISILLGIPVAYLIGMGCLMLYYSKVLKLKDRDELLNLVHWLGSEFVLDVGCGRGLMLIGAAKRLSSGKAIGIDIWQQQDQANNNSSAVLLNATIEGVAERVEIQTADMRQMPFSENYFDIVLSHWAVHNLEAEIDREKALNEIIRVLKPNGIVVLADITHQAGYAKYFELHGLTNIRSHNHPIRDAVLKTATFGSFAPSAVSACKIA